MDDSNLSAPADADSRVILVIISSTSRDMRQERDPLVKQVFPELRPRWARRFVTPTEVDVRWSITEAQVSKATYSTPFAAGATTHYGGNGRRAMVGTLRRSGPGDQFAQYAASVGPHDQHVVDSRCTLRLGIAHAAALRAIWIH